MSEYLEATDEGKEKILKTLAKCSILELSRRSGINVRRLQRYVLGKISFDADEVDKLEKAQKESRADYLRARWVKETGLDSNLSDIVRVPHAVDLSSNQKIEVSFSEAEWQKIKKLLPAGFDIAASLRAYVLYVLEQNENVRQMHFPPYI